MNSRLGFVLCKSLGGEMTSLFHSYRTCCSVLRFGTNHCRNRDRRLLAENCIKFIAPSQFCNVNNFSSDAKLTVANPAVRKYLDNVIQRYDNAKAGINPLHEDSELHPLISLLENRLSIMENISSLDELGKEKEIRDLVAEEQAVNKTRLEQLDQELIETLLTTAARDECRDVILEITAGVGGQEAMLFARDLYNMYLGYLNYLGYDCDLLDHGTGDAGGTRHVIIAVSGHGAFSTLRHEAGVHRVQRIPATERAGRVHTSTVTVAVLPQPSDIEISLADKDLKIEVKRSSGAGGQHVNTTNSAVRIVHLPTGVAVECQSQRSQLSNKESAMRTLRARIYAKQLAEQQSSTRQLRKSQQGLGLRNEKIRTYNFQQNRVTDHRLENGTVHNLKGFLEGGEVLSKLAISLEEELRKAVFLEIINDAQNS